MSDNASGSPTIRPMIPSDLDKIVEIDMKVLGKPRREYWEMKLNMAENRLRVASLVAELDGQMVGFIIGNVSRWEYGVPETVGWIDTIGVDPDYQKKGIAKVLFSEMTNSLKKAGVGTIYTFVKRLDWKLLKFFNGLGFREGDMVNLQLEV